MAVNLPELDGLLPVPGVRLGTACAGIKHLDRDDLVLLVLDPGTTVSAVFTQSGFRAAPVEIAESRIREGQPRVLLINSGNANAATGEPGAADARELCDHAARRLGDGLGGEQVLPFSTGVIGERLPVDAIRQGIDSTATALSGDRWDAAATAIMTTDTGPKAVSKRIRIEGAEVCITGMAKGSGMLKPDMATLLAFICCDAQICKVALDKLTREVANKSFNRLTIDGDTSTNDAFVIAATGVADHRVIEQAGESYDALRVGLETVACELAKRIVRDGEGATKFVTVQVTGGATETECLAVAYTIAESPLVKTAIFAGDPNWGRFCMAIGRAGIADLDSGKVSLSLDDVVVARGGLVAEDYVEAAAADVMARDEYAVNVDLGRGDCQAAVWTSDLSYEYVRINAEYRT